MNKAVLTKYGNRFLIRQKKLARAFVPHIYKAIRNQYKAFIDEARRSGYNHAIQRLGIIVKPDEIQGVINKLYLAAWNRESNLVLSQIKTGYKLSGFPLTFNDLVPVLDEYLKVYKFKNSAIQISNTTKKDISRRMAALIDQGNTFEQALDLFQETAYDNRNSLSRHRALFIAQMESVRGMNFGSLIGAYMTGKDLDKMWVTMHDVRVRGLPNYYNPFSHVNLEGVKTSLMKPFYNNEDIKYPCDPDADILNTGGCRCSMIFIEKKHPSGLVSEPMLRSLKNFMSDFITNAIIGVAVGLLTEKREVEHA